MNARGSKRWFTTCPLQPRSDFDRGLAVLVMTGRSERCSGRNLKQWKAGYSARTLAHCWEAADGFPSEVAQALSQTTDALLANLMPLLAVPEFKVPLPGGPRASQNDLFVLARSSSGPVSIMVEGKVKESF